MDRELIINMVVTIATPNKSEKAVFTFMPIKP